MNTGYEEHITKTKILHVSKGHSKLISERVKELQKQLQTVKIFSDDVYMEFVRDKCAKIVRKKGKLVHSQNLLPDINRETQQLERGKTYWYVGTEEREGMQHQQMKEGSKREYARGLRRTVLKSELNAKNKITAAGGSLVFPVFRCNFGILNWKLEEMQTNRWENWKGTNSL